MSLLMLEHFKPLHNIQRDRLHGQLGRRHATSGEGGKQLIKTKLLEARFFSFSFIALDIQLIILYRVSYIF